MSILTALPDAEAELLALLESDADTLTSLPGGLFLAQGDDQTGRGEYAVIEGLTADTIDAGTICGGGPYLTRLQITVWGPDFLPANATLLCGALIVAQGWRCTAQAADKYNNTGGDLWRGLILTFEKLEGN